MPIQVIDPFGVPADPALPALSLAVDPAVVEREFKRGLPLLAGPVGVVRVKTIRIIRYRPGRRCLIEYDVRVEQPGTKRQKRTLVGKMRVRQFGMSDFRLMRKFWRAGFDSCSLDGISVPKPIGVLPKFRMWLQLKVPGRPVSELLAEPMGEALAKRVAEAAHKLHRSGVRAKKRHTMSDELRILEQCLQAVAALEPRWERRLERLFRACKHLAKTAPKPAPCGVHRDFYPDQVLANGNQLYLLDFDLYCRGDPGLDIGNFLGHITEQSLRTYSDPAALSGVEQALEERFVELSGEDVRPAVRAYAALTLARHVYLSTRFPERRSWTETLLELCEVRLGVAAHGAVYSSEKGAS
ncbi:MAG: aminoglycoside phosphotransferase family protein [Pirellulales bacterium]|nr:aminoglycoside phosphotransferase family protein [Pirellulales bacterium]